MPEHNSAIERDKVVKIIGSVINQVGKEKDFSREKIATDILDLAKVIEEARREIAQMQPIPVEGDEDASAKDELDAVVQETAKATGAIMDSCDTIQSALSGLEGDTKPDIEQAVMDIFEACSFQDITGQRITKVVKAIKKIDEKVEMLVGIIGTSKSGGEGDTRTGDEALLNGPQMSEKAMSQEDIDALLDSFD